MAGYESCSKKVISCATCDYWNSDYRFPSSDRASVLYESYQKAKCMGIMNLGQWTAPRHRCKEWKTWRKVNMHKKFQIDVTEEQRKARLADKSDNEIGVEVDEKKVARRFDG